MARQGRIMGSGLLRKRNGDSAGATGVTGGGHCARLPAVEGPERASGVLTGARLRALRTVAGG